MKKLLLGFTLIFGFSGGALGADSLVSEDSETCMECHASLHPGIVQDWLKSAHAKVSPAQALKKPKLERRISVEKVPDPLANVAVGCAECHTMNEGTHQDSFEHNDYQVHTVVTPNDCAVCHEDEALQYQENLMSKARRILLENPVYMDLMTQVNGIHRLQEKKITVIPPNADTNADACLYCHGTKVEMKGLRTVDSDMGEMDVPILSGWPNQGVGRLNPDGTTGSCSACHVRHQYSIEMARRPYTCSECHKGPDAPAYAVYQVSKHGNIHSVQGKEWDFGAVPWKVGKDFTAPTCATCHVSLLVGEDDGIVAERTHQMNNRIAWRLFGVPYAHAHPKSSDTSIIRNKAGLPLPTELTGEPASQFLIDAEEQQQRWDAMKTICLSCHGYGWVDGHFERLENTIETTNGMTLTSTEILITAWNSGAAKGLEQNDSLFNDTIERKWTEQWLFYANAARLASAMAGADYGVFANGRWYLSKNIQEMLDYIHMKK
jgi:hydroxylamine dehydrogenase